MSEGAHAPGERRVAVILSGGGARGAYEVGVLWYLFSELTRLRGSPPPVDIVCGTSVGAINACFLAACLHEPEAGLRRLVDVWSELQLTRVLGFGFRQVLSLPKLLRGGGADGRGLFDVTPMAELVQREVSWRSVSRCLRRGQLCALSVSCTEVSTGRTVVFIQTSPNFVVPDAAPPRTLFRSDRIGPQHALASAAIPLIFPPVRIDNELYLDGGLRQNTPIAPALRMGATHIFAIGSSRDVRGVTTPEAHAHTTKNPGAAFLLGKVLNAFLLDHIDADMELLGRLNQVIADGTAAYGSSFLTGVNAEAKKQGTPAYRYVNALGIHPSEDIGRLANEHLKRGRLQGDPIITKKLFTLLDLGADAEADLASYLLFDGPFCRRLIEMGRADAHARREELLEFFGDSRPQEGSPDDGHDESGMWGPASMQFPIGT